MPAILRVKRKRDEEPASVLLVGQKRRKVDQEDKDTTESRFHLAATFHTDQPLDKTVLKNALLKRKAAEEESTSSAMSSNKHSEQQVNSPVVKQAKTEIPWSSLEFAEASLEDGDQQKENLPINWQSCCDKDEPAVLCNGEPMVRSKVKPTTSDESEYVYDFYYVEPSNTDSKISIDDFLYVKPYVGLEMVPEKDEDEDENDYAEDDDSNDENNWRNDYPEEEDSEDEKSSDENSEYFDYSGRGGSMFDADSSIDDYMRASMRRMRLSEDEDDDYYS